MLCSAAISLLNPLAVQLVYGVLSSDKLVLVFLFEGGIGLVTSTAIALSSTPSISKAGELSFGRAPWSKESERNAERVAAKWIIGSTVLILTGFVVSVF